MPRFSDQFVHQVQQATDIVEVVSQHVALKKVGKEFVGLCPFHDDHKPSMYVSPAKQIFKCFACGAGGGVFQFLMLYEKSSFPEAVEALARRANIPISQEAPPGAEGLSKPDLLRVLKFAAAFFRDRLRDPGGARALDYARKRGLTDESIARFGLGYAPDFWDALLTAGRRERIGESQLVAAGLAVRRESGSGCYDRFRNRLMFPICDVAGEVIAFGGRALDENERAKYLNSPESPLFDKSACLYGLNWARETISSSGTAVVVEGYMDAVIPHQAGLSDVVATLGTSLTERHVRVLARYARQAVLVFDADEAGTAAAERALELFLSQRLDVRVATIPSGKDPCDYTLAEGAAAMRKLVDEAPDALEYLWRRRQEQYAAAGGSLARRRQVIEDFLRVVVSSSAYGAIDEVRRGQLAQHIAHTLNIPSTDLHQQMRRLARQAGRGAAPARLPGEDLANLAERRALEVLLNRPDLFNVAAEKVAPGDFADARLRAVAEAVWQLGAAGTLSLDELLAKEEISPLADLLADLATTGEKRGNCEHTLAGATEHLAYRRGEQAAQQLKESGLNDDTLRKLGEHFRRPDVRRLPKIS